MPDLLQHHAHDDHIIHGWMLQEVNLHEVLSFANLSTTAHTVLQAQQSLRVAVLGTAKAVGKTGEDALQEMIR